MNLIKKKELFAYGFSLLYAIIFGLSFLFSKIALDITTPFKLIAFRFLLAFLFLSLLVAFRIIKINYRGKSLKNLFILSLAQPVIYFIFETYGIKFSSTSHAGLMTALIPIIVSILGIIFLNENPSKAQWIFILLSVSGVIFIILMDSSPESQNTILGTIFLLVTVLVASLYNILSRKSSVYFSSAEITYFMMGTGAVFFSIIALIIDIINGDLGTFFYPLLNMDFLLSIAYLGILSSVVAFFSMNFALANLPASKASIFGNLSTVISIIAGVVILKEAFYYYHVIGSITIISGIIGTNYYNAKKARILEEEKLLNKDLY